MARQSTNPIPFNRSQRVDNGVLMSSGRAGVVNLYGYIPVLRGDSASGSVQLDFKLAEMPKSLLNGVNVRAQAWFIPKSIHPQFAGTDEFMASYTGDTIKALGQPDRAPIPFYTMLNAADSLAAVNSPLYKQLGIHLVAGSTINTDLIDAFNLVYNFRLAAHSSRLPKKQYAVQSLSGSVALPPAFWDMGRFNRVVPDYEEALVVGSLSLDVIAGRIPIPQFNRVGGPGPGGTTALRLDIAPTGMAIQDATASYGLNISIAAGETLFAEMAGQNVEVSLADIEKAKDTQAFAKIMQSYAGSNTTGFNAADSAIAHLMQGLSVPSDVFARPWLLDDKVVPVGFTERFSSDANALDTSINNGLASARLSINLPVSDSGGMILITAEMLPERIHERQFDDMLTFSSVSSLPDALRDVQRTLPVDVVLSRRLDAKHTTPSATYGFEPMNDKFNREFTRLGGAFYQASPTAPVTEQRAGLWQSSVVDPIYSEDHFLAPVPFPHSVFADTLAPAFEVVCAHAVVIVGLTQIGDVLLENNGEFAVAESV